MVYDDDNDDDYNDDDHDYTRKKALMDILAALKKKLVNFLTLKVVTSILSLPTGYDTKWIDVFFIYLQDEQSIESTRILEQCLKSDTAAN